MAKLRTFIYTTLLGGVVVVLPTVIMLFLVSWIVGLVAGWIAPVTGELVKRTNMVHALAVAVTLISLLLGCFLIGLIVRTRMGGWLFAFIERHGLKRMPGYSVVKETVAQLLGGAKSPFAQVALVQLFSNDTLASGFVTDTHDDGSCTVFVPTGPNPTSGVIYHLPGHCVHYIDVPVEETMRSIISCGAGSGKLIDAYRRAKPSAGRPADTAAPVEQSRQ
ncbi:MAG: DUF502 domain-containing protein [Planctomycetota bacterium]